MQNAETVDGTVGGQQRLEEKTGKPPNPFEAPSKPFRNSIEAPS
jgi:hypothetical protein